MILLFLNFFLFAINSTSFTLSLYDFLESVSLNLEDSPAPQEDISVYNKEFKSSFQTESVCIEGVWFNLPSISLLEQEILLVLQKQQDWMENNKSLIFNTNFKEKGLTFCSLDSEDQDFKDSENQDLIDSKTKDLPLRQRLSGAFAKIFPCYLSSQKSDQIALRELSRKSSLSDSLSLPIQSLTVVQMELFLEKKLSFTNVSFSFIRLFREYFFDIKKSLKPSYLKTRVLLNHILNQFPFLIPNLMDGNGLSYLIIQQKMIYSRLQQTQNNYEKLFLLTYWAEALNVSTLFYGEAVDIALKVAEVIISKMSVSSCDAVIEEWYDFLCTIENKTRISQLRAELLKKNYHKGSLRFNEMMEILSGIVEIKDPSFLLRGSNLCIRWNSSCFFHSVLTQKQQELNLYPWINYRGYLELTSTDKLKIFGWDNVFDFFKKRLTLNDSVYLCMDLGECNLWEEIHQQLKYYKENRLRRKENYLVYLEGVMTSLLNKIQELREIKSTHGDLRLNNLVRKGRRIYLIDPDTGRVGIHPENEVHHLYPLLEIIKMCCLKRTVHYKIYRVFSEIDCYLDQFHLDNDTPLDRSWLLRKYRRNFSGVSNMSIFWLPIIEMAYDLYGKLQNNSYYSSDWTEKELQVWSVLFYQLLRRFFFGIGDTDEIQRWIHATFTWLRCPALFDFYITPHLDSYIGLMTREDDTEVAPCYECPMRYEDVDSFEHCFQVSDSIAFIRFSRLQNCCA